MDAQDDAREERGPHEGATVQDYRFETRPAWNGSALGGFVETKREIVPAVHTPNRRLPPLRLCALAREP